MGALRFTRRLPAAIPVIILLFLCISMILPAEDAGAIPQFMSKVWAENCGHHIMSACFGERLKDDESEQDYTIHVLLWDVNGDPITTLAASDMSLAHPYMSTCPSPFSPADQGTDAEGYTFFAENPGRVQAGLIGDASDGVDCAIDTQYLVYALGIVLNEGVSTCVASNSPDLNGDLEVTVADFAKYSVDFNCVSNCDPCHDYDEDGVNGIADFAIFAGYFNSCVCEN